VNLKRKYEEEESDYIMEGRETTTTVKKNRLIETRGPITGLKQSYRTQTILPTCQEKRCHLFGFNVIICRAVDGAWFLSKKGSGREHNIIY
jgi:hypothetical protein